MSKRTAILIAAGAMAFVLIAVLVLSLRDTEEPVEIGDPYSFSDEAIDVGTIETSEDEGRAYEILVNYDEELSARNPLITKLPYVTSGFEVHYGVEDRASYEAFYTVILKPQTSKAARDEYAAEVDALRADASAWIVSQGFNPDDLLIQWTTR